MKSHASLGFLALVLFGLTSVTQAGGIASGGVPPTPVSVVIQETILAGNKPSLDLEKTVRIKTSEDLASGKVQAFFQVDDEVVNRIGRRRWCIEYSNFGQFTQASQEFQSALRSFDRVEVVETGHCIRR